MTQEPHPPEENEAEDVDTVAPDGMESEGEGSSIPDDALFSPDDPLLMAEGEIPEDAIFSPDDPLLKGTGGEGIVTSIGGSAARPPQKGRGLDWEIRHTADLLKNLERNLREQGIAALRVHSEVEPMDAMLRSFIAGFLVGRMDEEE